MAVTFALSAVATGETRLSLRTPEQALTELLAGPPDPFGEAPLRSIPVLEAAGARMPALGAARIHGFVDAVGTAYDAHLPLVLSPDDVWLMLTQGFANATRDIEPEGAKRRLVVRRDDFVLGSQNPWEEVFASFSEQIRAHVGDARHRLLVADFSTTGPLERAASEVVLMGALSSAFEYQFSTMCGIPELTLLGTPEDWKDLRRRAGVLCEQGLEWWWPPLLAVCDAFVDASEGRVDKPFWEDFFKLKHSSGGPYITGWINVLVPFLEVGGKLQRNRATLDWKEGMEVPFGGGPRDDHLPAPLTRASVQWRYLDEEVELDFCAGFLGVEQHENGAIRPGMGWAVLRSGQTTTVAPGTPYPKPTPPPEEPEPGLFERIQQKVRDLLGDRD